MQITYRVHSVHRHDLVSTETIDGQEVERRVRDGALTVELVDGEQHGHTFRFAPGAGMADALAMFAEGNGVVLTFAPA